MNKLKSFKKAIEEVREGNETALEASKKELTIIPELPDLGTHFLLCDNCHHSYTFLPQIAYAVTQ